MLSNSLMAAQTALRGNFCPHDGNGAARVDPSDQMKIRDKYSI
jgi:hypothetical protein